MSCLRLEVRIPATLILAVASIMGCQRPQPTPPSQHETVPAEEAIRLVNTNAAKISGTLRASGTVDGSAIDANGRSRSFHLDGVLFYLAPRNLRFDLKSLGERQLLLGSNDEGYWFFSAEDKQYRCGPDVEDLDLPSEIPVTPDQLIEALGLGGIPTFYDSIGPFQRIDGDFQQLIFIAALGLEAGNVQKEYWLDRSTPRLIRKVLFRGPDGDIQMNSNLDDYKTGAAEGLLLPHSMTAEWPVEGTILRFRISQWSLHPQIGPDGPQFATPAECETARR